VSKAFTKDEGAASDAVVVPRRAPLPEGVPNYVTRSGLDALRDELRGLEAQRASLDRGELAALAALDERIAELVQRIGTAQLVDVAAQPHDEVRFGATVTVLDEEEREHRYRIVGVDEADAKEGRIAFVAPLARALLGKGVGEVATVRTPSGESELEVVSITYDEA
jgi:transcription elongation factor GreB